MWSIIQAAGWPIWPLILCSVVALALIVERFISLKTAKVAPAKLVDEAITASRNGVPGPDVVTQLQQHSVLGEVLASGLRLLNANPKASDESIRVTLEASGRQAAAKLDSGSPDKSAWCAMAKRFATDVGYRVCDEALQLFGGYGYIREYPLERYLRDTRVHRILEGANEIMRVVIGRAEAARVRA